MHGPKMFTNTSAVRVKVVREQQYNYCIPILQRDAEDCVQCHDGFPLHVGGKLCAPTIENPCSSDDLVGKPEGVRTTGSDKEAKDGIVRS